MTSVQFKVRRRGMTEYRDGGNARDQEVPRLHKIIDIAVGGEIIPCAVTGVSEPGPGSSTHIVFVDEVERPRR